jgi:Holliday junction resolvase RusA-like endonuclease
MTQIKIKPLSVNEAWQGKRYKSEKYKEYEQTMFLLLPRDLTIPDGEIALTIDFGLSNVSNDIDNGLKPFIDILQKKYKFNDKKITKLGVKKTKVKKGNEYIRFSIL